MSQFQSVNEESIYQLRDPRLVLSLKTKVLSGNRYAVCYGCFDGALIFKLFRSNGTEILMRQWEFDEPVSAIDVFEPAAQVSRDDESEVADMSILLGTLLESAFVIEHLNIPPIQLPNTSPHDSILACLMTDVDGDGHTESLLATYGQKLLVYRRTPNGYQAVARDGGSGAPKQFAYPLYGLYDFGSARDGLCDLVVVSMMGAHHVKFNLLDAMKRLFPSAAPIIMSTTHDLE